MKRWVLVVGGEGEVPAPVRNICWHLGDRLDEIGFGLVFRTGDAAARVAADRVAQMLRPREPLSTRLREVFPAGGEPAFADADATEAPEGSDALAVAMARAGVVVLVGDPPPGLRAIVAARLLLPVGGASAGAAALLEELIRESPVVVHGALTRQRLEDLREPLDNPNAPGPLALHLLSDLERAFAPAPDPRPSGRRLLVLGGPYFRGDAFFADHLGERIARDGHALLLLGAKSAAESWIEPVIADAHRRALDALGVPRAGMCRQIVRERDETCSPEGEVLRVPHAPLADLREALKQADGVLTVGILDQARQRELAARAADGSLLMIAANPGPNGLAAQGVLDRVRRAFTPRISDQPPRAGAGDPIRIVFVSANPSGTRPLALDRELESLRATLHRAGLLERVRIASDFSARYEDLRALLVEHRPHVLHFSGHGADGDGILLAGDDGGQRPVAADALQALFAAVREHVRLVVLNACYSDPQARAIADAVGCAVGMRRSIRDGAAIAFSGGFYLALAVGEPVERAFALGRAAIVDADTDSARDDSNVPQIRTAEGTDPARVVLFRTDR